MKTFDLKSSKDKSFQNIFTHFHQRNIKTDNNVPISHVVLGQKIEITPEEIYQYCCNFDNKFLNRFFECDYVNFGTDGIIRDLFYLNKNKTIWYNTPNYMMISKYAEEFDLKYETIENADVIYIANPNGCTLTYDINPETFKDSGKVVIVDLSYYIYECNSFDEFIRYADYLKSCGFYVLYGASKILGLPGLRVGMCKCMNPEVFNSFHQPWQITSTSKIILDKCWNKDIINKHIKIIKESKEYFKDIFKEYIAFETDGPFLALTKDFVPSFKEQVRDYGDYYRFSVVDKDL